MSILARQSLRSASMLSSIGRGWKGTDPLVVAFRDATERKIYMFSTLKPPLFKIRRNKKERYVDTEEILDQLLLEMAQDDVKVSMEGTDVPTDKVVEIIGYIREALRLGMILLRALGVLALKIHIAERHHLTVAGANHGPEIVASLIADSDHGQVDLLIRRHGLCATASPPDAGGRETGEGAEDGRAFQEITTT